MSLNTRNWKAWQNLQPGTNGAPTLHVKGEVETSNGNQTPHLKEAVPQGINPKILILELSISATGVGPTVMGWKTATFQRPISRDQFSEVDIRFEGNSIARLPVEDAH